MTDQLYAALPQCHAARTPSEMDQLRKDLGDAQVAARREKDWTQRTRAESTAKSIERELHSAELELKHAHQRESRRFDARYKVVNACEPTHMPTVAYFEKPEAAAPKAAAKQVSNRAVRWPQKESERAELIAAACAEVRRAGLLAAT